MKKVELTKKSKRITRDKYIGRKYNMLIIVEFDHYEKNFLACFKCKCDCGNMCTAKINQLKTGTKKSCGCLAEQNKRDIGKRRKDQTTHGDSRTRLYRIWAKMKHRCRPLGRPETKYYGDRGITVCEEWNDYTAFKEWALANGYRDDLSIDRIDVNGNYEPSNCRWATVKEQNRNRRDTAYVDFRGKRTPLREVCEITKKPYATLYRRIFEYGMSVDDAINTEPIKGRRLRRG